MREIKFRVWDHHDQKMKYAEMEWFDDMFAFRFEHRGFEEEDNSDVVIMQYTGLKDKNGKEVYEGDVLRTPHFLDENGKQLYLYHRVVWSERLTGWQAVNMNETTDPPYVKTGSPQLWVYAKDEFEIIGHIHQNPELLTK